MAPKSMINEFTSSNTAKNERKKFREIFDPKFNIEFKISHTDTCGKCDNVQKELNDGRQTQRHVTKITAIETVRNLIVHRINGPNNNKRFSEIAKKRDKIHVIAMDCHRHYLAQS
ncbi:hypothetical protein ANN_15103 [Periplaneta americana]|uniref:Uncharacterized protein n=1 Tax=Periplaneta americana TaxID=6978 RepID=A0ABQ8SZD1_PERAM|nr:hypothetical protein ANN_15103 [Periplaneta americana]